MRQRPTRLAKNKPGSDTGDFLQPGQVFAQDSTVKEQQGLQRLILGACADLAFDSQMGQELLDADSTKVAGMMSLMKPQIAPDPLQIGLFGAIRQMTCAHLLPRNLQQTGLLDHAPCHPRGLCGTTPTTTRWNQAVSQWSTTISDGFVRLYPDTSVFYI